MNKLITDPDQITCEWLSRTLRRVGVLAQGAVSSVEKDVSSPFGAVVVHLALSYSADASPLAPSRLLLKIPDPSFTERYPEAGQKEVRFYQVLVDSAIVLPVPRCYDAVCSEEGKGFHLLLEDLSETHVPLQAPLPPTRSQCEQLVDTLGRIHAFWWDHPMLGRNLGTLPSEVPEWDFCGGIGEMFPCFVDFVGEGLFDDRREMYSIAPQHLRCPREL